MPLNNDCRFEGRIVRTPELRKTGNDKAVTSFSLAVAREYPNAQNEWLTDFIDFVAYGKRAERICEKFQQGDLIKVSGMLQVRQYKDKQDNNRKVAEVIVNEIRKAYMPKKSSVGDTEKNEDYSLPDEDPYAMIPTDEPLPF